MNWAYNLDMLAQNGVLDFDGASYVMGQNPRYIGSPNANTSPYAQLPPAPNLNQPQMDEFKPNPQQAEKPENKNKDYIKNPSWKKWAFGALALGGLIFGGIKLRGVFKKAKVKNKTTTKFKGKINDFFKKTGEFIKKYWNKFLNIFRKNKKL